MASARRAGYGPTYRHPPYFVLKASATDDQLGAAIITAIEGFGLITDPPSDEVMEAATAELLVRVGVASEQTFERGASLVHVRERRDRWTVEPFGRERGYWVPLKETTHVKLSSPAPGELGKATRDAFELLRGRR